MQKKLVYFYDWSLIPDPLIVNVMAEFAENGAKYLVFSHTWLEKLLRQPEFIYTLRSSLRTTGLKLASPHGLWGQPYDINCPDRARHERLIADHIAALRYAADFDCHEYVLHLGSYVGVYEHTPSIETSRAFAIDTLEKLLPEAEKLGVVIAVENAFKQVHSPDELLYYIRHFNSPYIQCCFDSGHANIRMPGAGKCYEKYDKAMHDAWGDEFRFESDALQKILPHVVTCHLHDNNGYKDEHKMPGQGTIDWQTMIPLLAQSPRLVTVQTEVLAGTYQIPIRKLCATFERLLKPLFPEKL